MLLESKAWAVWTTSYARARHPHQALSPSQDLFSPLRMNSSLSTVERWEADPRCEKQKKKCILGQPVTRGYYILEKWERRMLAEGVERQKKGRDKAYPASTQSPSSTIPTPWTIRQPCSFSKMEVKTPTIGWNEAFLFFQVRLVPSVRTNSMK